MKLLSVILLLSALSVPAFAQHRRGRPPEKPVTVVDVQKSFATFIQLYRTQLHKLSPSDLASLQYDLDQINEALQSSKDEQEALKNLP